MGDNAIRLCHHTMFFLIRQAILHFFIPTPIFYYIHSNPQKHFQLPLEENSMPQNKMEKEYWSLIYGKRRTLSVYFSLFMDVGHALTWYV